VTRCTPLAGEFVDRSLDTKYLKHYIEGAGITELQKQGKITWALHLYDTQYDGMLRGVHHPHSRDTLRRFLRQTQGSVWITESGVFQYHLNNDGVDIRPRADTDGTAAATDLKWLFDKVLPYKYGTQRSRITRYFYYQWADDNRSPNPPFYADSKLERDKFGTGLTRNPFDAPGKVYCVFFNREDPVKYRDC
jgi:hypothetical protein